LLSHAYVTKKSLKLITFNEKNTVLVPIYTNKSRLHKHVKHTLAYYTLLHFIVNNFFLFYFVLRRITLNYTLAATLYFKGFCKHKYKWPIVRCYVNDSINFVPSSPCAAGCRIQLTGVI